METVLGIVVLNTLVAAVVLNPLVAAVVLNPPVAALTEEAASEVAAVRAPPTTVQHPQLLRGASYSKSVFAQVLDKQGAVAQQCEVECQRNPLVLLD